MQEALHIDVGEIDFQRAKKRIKIPAVLSQSEVTRLNAELAGTDRLMTQVIVWIGRAFVRVAAPKGEGCGSRARANPGLCGQGRQGPHHLIAGKGLSMVADTSRRVASTLPDGSSGPGAMGVVAGRSGTQIQAGGRFADRRAGRVGRLGWRTLYLEAAQGRPCVVSAMRAGGEWVSGGVWWWACYCCFCGGFGRRGVGWAWRLAWIWSGGAGAGAPGTRRLHRSRRRCPRGGSRSCV